MGDPGELAMWTGGGAGALAVAQYVFRRLQRKEDQDEAARDSKLDAVLAKVTSLELEMRTLVEKLSTQTGAIGELKGRVEGISTNHGNRIGTIEQTLAEHRSRILALEGSKKRR